MAFKKAKTREALGEAGLIEYAVRALASKMRTERELRRLMQRRAAEGEAGTQAMDKVIARLKELNYLSDTRFAADYTRLRKENEKFGQRRVQQDLAAKGVAQETARAVGRLLRAGFSAGTVFKVLREWGVEVEEVDVEETAE